MNNSQSGRRAHLTAAAKALSGNFSVHTQTEGYILRGLRHFSYNGTTLDLVIQAMRAGAQIGDSLVTPGIGGHSNRWELVGQGGGDRTLGGAWVKRKI